MWAIDVLSKYSSLTIFIIVLAVLILAQIIIELIKYYWNLLTCKVKKDLTQKDIEKIILENQEELKEIKNKQYEEHIERLESVKKSIEHDEKLESSISELAIVLETLKLDRLENDKKFDLIFETLRESLGDRIEQKSCYYIASGEIPMEELSGYISLHDAYKNIGGNHFRDILFSKVINSFTDLEVGEDGRVKK